MLFRSINACVLAQSKQNGFVGLLFEGSIGHIFQTLLAGALRLKDSQIRDFYMQCVAIITRGLHSMVAQYEDFYKEAKQNMQTLS